MTGRGPWLATAYSIANDEVAASKVNVFVTLTPNFALGLSVTKDVLLRYAGQSSLHRICGGQPRSRPGHAGALGDHPCACRRHDLFPTGTKIYDYGNKSLVTSQAAGMTWFKYDAAAITTDCKLFADAGSGLLAQSTATSCS